MNTHKLKVHLQSDELKAESVHLSENTASSLWSKNDMNAVVTCICSELELAEWEELHKFCILTAQHPRNHWTSWQRVGGEGREVW